MSGAAPAPGSPTGRSTQPENRTNSPDSQLSSSVGPVRTLLGSGVRDPIPEGNGDCGCSKEDHKLHAEWKVKDGGPEGTTLCCRLNMSLKHDERFFSEGSAPVSGPRERSVPESTSAPSRKWPLSQTSVLVYRHSLFPQLVASHEKDPNFLQKDDLAIQAEKWHHEASEAVQRSLPDHRCYPLAASSVQYPSPMTHTFPLSLVEVGAKVQESAKKIAEQVAGEQNDPREISTVLESYALDYLSLFTAKDVKKLRFSRDELQKKLGSACTNMMEALSKEVDWTRKPSPNADDRSLCLQEIPEVKLQSLTEAEYQPHVPSWWVKKDPRPCNATHIVTEIRYPGKESSQFLTCTPTLLSVDPQEHPDGTDSVTQRDEP